MTVILRGGCGLSVMGTSVDELGYGDEPRARNLHLAGGRGRSDDRRLFLLRQEAPYGRKVWLWTARCRPRGRGGADALRAVWCERLAINVEHVTVASVPSRLCPCLLYTSDAADDLLCVDL